ncbi:MAG: hypothetical protein JSS63_11650 [Bacteroidetes bacterium]|nr:hypothetical protein [Bacteroidota bacterium]
MKKLFLLLFSFICVGAYAQLPGGAFSIGGGPTVGYQDIKFDDINSQLTLAGIPALKNGVVYFGGGGFVDIPFKNFKWLRVGGFARGFSARTSGVSGGVTKSALIDFGEGGITLDYVFRFSAIDITIGTSLGTGEYKLNLYQSGSTSSTWTNLWSGTTNNSSRNLKTRIFSYQPALGIGTKLANFLYAKLNAGYTLSSHTDWKADDDMSISGIPEGIKPDGFNINFTINAGLFFR